MISIIIWVIVAYLAYRFIFGFLVPLLRVSRQMKRQVREFQKRANGEFQGYQKDNFAQQQKPQEPPVKKGGEYIDFEEIKEK